METDHYVRLTTGDSRIMSWQNCATFAFTGSISVSIYHHSLHYVHVTKSYLRLKLPVNEVLIKEINART